MPHPYCTPQQVMSQMPHVRTWGQGNVPSPTEIEVIIEEADSLVDSYLAARFDVPFTAAPDSVIRISRQLAVADVRERLYGDAITEDRLGPGIRKRAMEQLMAIANGLAALDPESVVQADTVAGGNLRPEGSWAADSEATFTLDDEF